MIYCLLPDCWGIVNAKTSKAKSILIKKVDIFSKKAMSGVERRDSDLILLGSLRATKQMSASFIVVRKNH